MLPWNSERRRWWVASDRQLNGRLSTIHCAPFSPAEYRCMLTPQRMLSAVQPAQRISVQTEKQPHLPLHWKSLCAKSSPCAKSGKCDGWWTRQIQNLWYDTIICNTHNVCQLAESEARSLPRRVDHGEHRAQAYNWGLGRSPQWGPERLKLKAFCPFSYKRRKKS